MARIRSLKPGFFKNEDLASLSAWHRLCYQGLWCYADREGRLEDRPKRLKAEIFPYDDLDFEDLLGGLVAAGFIVRYAVNGACYIAIPTFGKHQVPRKDEHDSKIPPPSERDDASATVPRLCSDGTATAKSVGSREWGVGNREGGDPAPEALPARRAEDLSELWNAETTPPIPRCRDLTPKRRKKAALRLKDRPLEEWRDIFRRINASAFMRGDTDRGNWRVSFDWIIENADNAVKVLEGKYDDKPRGPTKGPWQPAPTHWSDNCQHEPKCERLDWHQLKLAKDAQQSA